MLLSADFFIRMMSFNERRLCSRHNESLDLLVAESNSPRIAFSLHSSSIVDGSNISANVLFTMGTNCGKTSRSSAFACLLLSYEAMPSERSVPNSTVLCQFENSMSPCFSSGGTCLWLSGSLSKGMSSSVLTMTTASRCKSRTLVVCFSFLTALFSFFSAYSC